MSNILIIDDDIGVLTALKLLLVQEQHSVTLAQYPDAALTAITQQEFTLAFVDMNFHRDTTSGTEGLSLLSHIQTLAPELRIIAMTGWASVSLAVEALKMGAHDFIEKPWANQRLLSIVRNQLDLSSAHQQQSRLLSENQLLSSARETATTQAFEFPSIAMQQIAQTLTQIADTAINVFIGGEHGTGKSSLAKMIHEKSSRANAPFIAVNMGSIPENLFESEMFGHTKGAFTDAKNARIGRFELADTGTLFLDEIGNIPLNQQAKLLQVLETHNFEKVGSSITKHTEVRIISASNAKISELIANGLFRQDLWYRLNTMEIIMPPLRERKEDIPLLCKHILHKLCEKHNRPSATLSTAAYTRLASYHWPGNIRELQNVLERGLILTNNHTIDTAHLLLPDAPSNSVVQPTRFFTDNSLDEIEKNVILDRIAFHQGNMTQTAESLGLSRSAFYRRLEKYKIT